MGKSSKKSASKVESAPAVTKDIKSLKKGKRAPEDDLETKLNLKKQKKNVIVAKKLPKKAESSDSDSSDSEEEVKAKKVPAKKVVAKADSSSDESDDSSSDDEPAQKKAVTNGAVAKKSKDDSSSEEESSDEEVAAAKKPAAKNGSVKAKEESSSEEEDSDSDEEPAKKPAAAAAKVAAKPAAKEDSSSEEESDDDSEDEKPAAKKAAPAKAASSSSSDEESDEESEDEKPAAKKAKAETKAPSKEESSRDESSDESEEESEEEKETPKKKSADVEMVDAEKSAKQPKTPSTPAAEGSKTLFVANLSFSIERADVENFFKEAGEVVDVRFATNREDGSFRGFGHVQFATAEAAAKALTFAGRPLLGRDIRLDVAEERGERPAYTPQSRNAGGGGAPQGQTVFVKGFDSSQSEDDIKNALSEHFASCGEITRVSVPIDRETGASKGIAYIDFQETSEKEKAFELDGSDLGGYSLKVDEPRPKADNSGGGYGGGRFSSGRGGRSSGRFSGGRDGGRGGRRGGRGGRDSAGRGRSSFQSTGKKTTFGDYE